MDNLNISHDGSIITMEYDLSGKKGEKVASVAVSVEVEGKKYDAGMLSIEGDFGDKISIGLRKKIVWYYSNDVPQGFYSSLKCTVDAVPSSKIRREWESPLYGVKEGKFAVSRQVVTDTKSKLMWFRNAGYSTRLLRRDDALELISNLNSRRFAGYNDWRLPSAAEFEKLTGSGLENGWGNGISRYIFDYLTNIGFLNVRSGSYWTSSASSPQDDKAFVVSTWNGSANAVSTKNYHYLLPVRAISPVSRQ